MFAEETVILYLVSKLFVWLAQRSDVNVACRYVCTALG